MRRTLAAAATVLVLSLAVTGCGGDGGAAKAGSNPGSSASPATSDLPTDLSSCLPTEIPREGWL